MTNEAQRVLREAMQLSEAERVMIAGHLLETLPPVEDDDEISKAWAQEIERRVKELDDGTVQAVPWEIARRQIRGE